MFNVVIANSKFNQPSYIVQLEKFFLEKVFFGALRYNNRSEENVHDFHRMLFFSVCMPFLLTQQGGGGTVLWPVMLLMVSLDHSCWEQMILCWMVLLSYIKNKHYTIC